MSFIFDATQPISPERQKVAQALLERQKLQSAMSVPAPQPQNIGEGLQAFGQGIFDGFEMRSLHNQAKAPTDAWADMRTVGQTMPTTDNAGGFGFGAAAFQNPFKRIFG